MSEEVKTDAEKAAEFKPPTSQEEFDRMVGARLERERSKFADYDDIKAKAAKFDQADEANKTELQRERERAEKAETALTPTQQQVARLEVALEKGLTATQAKRLVGTSKEEFAADADELLSDLGAKAKPKPDAKKLHSGSSADSDQGTGRERAAAALRQLRNN
ncbi:hypothetical protein [Nocardioides sp. WS12]|uniref:hypothetical protein n=1 Tax=Nocardioides sp. WS12 TaxID=2486272 RepID=UPI0015F8D1CB|nr:hypothetical protein [Nocardioides sp. WS12]